MKKIKVQTKTVSGVEAFVFSSVATSFLIKNFTDNDIFVSFEDNFTDSEAIRIGSNMGEEISSNINRSLAFETNTIFVKGSGSVEVQQLDPREVI